ncbi:protein-tyrosine phosphatase [Rhodoferax ferrireducens]|uniref:protein-tyrosine-phosphatase n=1 Tax=Rhodoferax ferrireducens TaxID=192843 RepID=A0ABU2C7I2_9BURK|nr:low molecular weight protein-tyrosine-phosphatase [Rhodoferax ferrireducens]MDR7377268.1 protein-tyrosine phosphatase [Rhodoferax ferrireducens]
MNFLRPPPATKFLMVCRANICRSPMAQAVAQHLVEQAGLARDIVVDSAGTHVGSAKAKPDARAQTLLSQRGYALGKNRSRQVIAKDFVHYDLVLALDQANLNDLRQLCPAEHTHKLRLLLEYAEGTDLRDVPDPYYGNLQGFEHVLELCEAGARGLVASYQAFKR